MRPKSFLAAKREGLTGPLAVLPGGVHAISQLTLSFRIARDPERIGLRAQDSRFDAAVTLRTLSSCERDFPMTERERSLDA
jgi:hypothetical protein